MVKVLPPVASYLRCTDQRTSHRRHKNVTALLHEQVQSDSLPYVVDGDGDGVADTADAFPLDPNETIDTDSDGIGNNADTDDDGDGVADTADAFPLDPSESLDTDGDAIGNGLDTDDDGDGTDDLSDVLPLDPTVDPILILLAF